MKKITLLLICISLMLSKISLGQQSEEKPKFGITFSGFVKNDAFYDTRQTATVREGHFLLFPSNVSLDEEGKDINAEPSFNMLAIQSRLTGRITGPDAFGAKTSGVIEGAFFGHSEADINGFRLRHAFAKFNWEKTELIAGQYWHPLFMVQAFPEVISFNTGVPFQPFSRNPQLRLTHKINNFALTATAYTQRDFPSTGPAGQSSIYMRNAAMPGTNLLISFSPADNDNIWGIGGDYKVIVPELVTDKNYKTDSKLESFSATAFSKIKFKNTTWKLQALLGQNAFDLLMLGGYGIKYNNYDSLTGIKEYTNITTGTVWTELYTNFGIYQAGFFAGYTKNFGSQYNLMPGSPLYSRGGGIDYVYRISPRFLAKQGNATIALEIEYTTAAYGSPNSLGMVQNAEEVTNIRALLSFIYSF